VQANITKSFSMGRPKDSSFFLTKFRVSGWGVFLERRRQRKVPPKKFLFYRYRPV